MSFDSILKGPYPVPPSREDERIRAGMDICQPESIHGVVWSRPDLISGGHRIVLDFAIDRKRRPDNRAIRCSMCSANHPKFLAGSVLWSPDGWLRVIGHVCAKKDENFGEANYRRLQQEHKQRELDDKALELLECILPFIQPLRKNVMELRAALKFMEGQHLLFFREVPELARHLVDAMRRGGALTISRERPLNSGRMAFELSTTSPMSRYEEISVGILRGTAFLRKPKKFLRSKEADGILLALAMIPEGEGAGPLLELMGGGEHRVTIVAMAVTRAVERAMALAKDYNDAMGFISMENLDALQDWGRHPDNLSPFSMHRSDREVIFKLADLSRARLSLNWPPAVGLSISRQVAEASLNLSTSFHSVEAGQQ